MTSQCHAIDFIFLFDISLQFSFKGKKSVHFCHWKSFSGFLYLLETTAFTTPGRKIFHGYVVRMLLFLKVCRQWSECFTARKISAVHIFTALKLFLPYIKELHFNCYFPSQELLLFFLFTNLNSWETVAASE